MRVLIVEDEAPAARRLQRLVGARPGQRAEDIACVESVAAARQALAAGRWDLVLLDLELNGADGFEIIRGAANAPRVIVVSARIDRAIDAFDNAVIDFVTKPVNEERLNRALDRAAAPPAGPGEMSLVVRSAGRIDLAPVGSIVSLSGADDYVEVALANGRRFLHDARLDELERRLPAAFLRVHRSHIVNTAHIEGLRSRSRGQRVIELAGGSEVPVSRRRAGEVEVILARKSASNPPLKG